MVDSPSGKAAQVTVVEKNPYQGMHFYLNEPIDLNGIKSVSFRVKQNASEKYPVNACLQLHYNEKRSQGFYVSFSMKYDLVDFCRSSGSRRSFRTSNGGSLTVVFFLAEPKRR